MLALIFHTAFFSSSIFSDCSSPEQKDKWLSLLQRYVPVHTVLMLSLTCLNQTCYCQICPRGAPFFLNGNWHLSAKNNLRFRLYTKEGAGEMAQWSGIAALSGDPSLVPNTHVRWLTTASISRQPNALFQPLWYPTYMCHIVTQTYTHKVFKPKSCKKDGEEELWKFCSNNA